MVSVIVDLRKLGPFHPYGNVAFNCRATNHDAAAAVAVGINSHAPGGGGIRTTILCSTADERPSVQSISEPHSSFPVYFSLLGV